MARMHARRKGRSGSHRPHVAEGPEWVPLSPSEVEMKVLALRKKGLTTAQIGTILRDQYGVADLVVEEAPADDPAGTHGDGPGSGLDGELFMLRGGRLYYGAGVQ
ncbi:MAG TPA: hypothetical protein EYP43_00670, partial [Thermoplasmata archaeon]|nr:hypothetical protein [Thermoplasmata archaeon]